MVVNPNPSMPWFSPTGTSLTSATTSQPAASQRTRWYPTEGGPVTLPGDMSDDDATQWVSAYNQYIRKMEQSWQASSGLERQQIEAAIEDAKAGRRNAIEIAQLQAKTSRYGVDVGSRDRMAELRENQRQYDQTHGLNMQKFGLDVAEAYTRFAQTPDMMFARNDFMSGLARAGQGATPQPLAEQGTPQPKTWDEFSVLRGYGQGVGAGGGGAGTPRVGPGGAPAPGQPDAGSGLAADPRMKAIRAVSEALPPSDTSGGEDQDWAALRAIESLYLSPNTQAGAVSRIGKSGQKIAQAGLARLGYDPQRVQEDYNMRQIGQGRVGTA